jgi:oxygen-independent coproporphyrinogen-3 oxidase
LTDHQRLIREMILQLKIGAIDASYFRDKFGREIGELFREPWALLTQEGFVEIDGDAFRLTRAGLLRVDGLLPRFFETEFQNVRYT